VPKNSSARFIEHEITKGAVASDETGLLPQAVAGGRCDAANDNVPDLSFGVTRYDVDDFG
jgi:hypothetical protein